MALPGRIGPLTTLGPAESPEIVECLPGGWESVEVQFLTGGHVPISTFVRGQQQEEDASGHAFGRYIEGAAGLQYAPDANRAFRLQIAQEFLNQLDAPMRGLNVSLQLQVRF